MTTSVKNPVAIACIFTWIGFVCAISFMEAWLKFRAPGITLSLGLGIGRLVFNALNKIEWILAAGILLDLFISKKKLLTTGHIALLIPLLLLTVQTLWLLPALDARAEAYLQGSAPAPSRLHIYYVSMEAIKVISLFISGIYFFKPSTSSS
ncbi:MAG TPA: hypothetical protein PKC69_03340 [Chitinophagaceae bacterium]|nr:hypothetical protein [Chitinophagaceae bacterium]